MRIWDVPCSELADAQLLGEHRELHCLWAVMGTSRGYSRHRETLRWVGYRWRLWHRHEEQAEEMGRRGWKHASPLDCPPVDSLVRPPSITPIDEQRQMLAERGGLR